MLEMLRYNSGSGADLWVATPSEGLITLPPPKMFGRFPHVPPHYSLAGSTNGHGLHVVDVVERRGAEIN